jgi:anti-sigma B factor antagonist
VKLSYSSSGNRFVVAATGELDIATAAELRRSLLEVLDQQTVPLVIDLSGVDFVDSVTLGVFVNVHKRLLERGQALTFVNPRASVKRVFEVTALDKVFTIEDG